MHHTFKKQLGVTLIEMLIVVMLISILTIAARPYYYQYLTKARRLEAKTSLLRMATEMERLRLNTSTYKAIDFSLLTVAPYTENKHYQLNIENASENDYLISATPIGDQASRDLICGTLLMSASHKKYITGHGKLDDCWEA